MLATNLFCFIHLQFYKCLFLLIKIVSSAFMKALFYKISCDGAKEFLHLKKREMPVRLVGRQSLYHAGFASLHVLATSRWPQSLDYSASGYLACFRRLDSQFN